MTLYITINRGVIDSNRKHGTRRPPIAVRTSKRGRAIYYRRFKVPGTTTTIVYQPDKPLPCGARVWLEVK